jgi:hypothetical protein
MRFLIISTACCSVSDKLGHFEVISLLGKGGMGAADNSFPVWSPDSLRRL